MVDIHVGEDWTLMLTAVRRILTHVLAMFALYGSENTVISHGFDDNLVRII